MKNFNRRIYPIDIEKLDKGSIIAVETLEALLGFKRDHARYGLGVMKIKDWVEEGLDFIGRPATVRTEKGSLRVLYDNEASGYNESEGNRCLRGFSRSHRRIKKVDASKLQRDEVPRHDRRLEVMGKLASAIHTVRRVTRVTGKTHREDRPRKVG